MTPPTLVARLVETHMGGPFLWGVSDCCCGPANVFADLTGVDVLKPHRAAYPTRVAMYALMDAAGGPLPFAAHQMLRAGLEPVEERAGALGVAITVRGFHGAVCITPGMWAIKAKAGFTLVKIGRCDLGAWAMLTLLTLALILLPGMAQADPLTALIVSGLGSVGITGAAASIIGSLLTSVILSRASQLLAGKSTGGNTALELQRPSSRPPYRFVYGKAWATGSPTGLHVKGNILYGCWILNSRPSEGPFTLLLDKRAVSVTGDPYNFGSGGGATANAAPFTSYVKMWIGRGDQTTAPAQIVAEAPEFYASTDGWQGVTVVWLRLDAGKASSRATRWTAAPPEVMMDGYWSRVWDPRILAQDQSDPTTWDWSANQALCVLDALLSNPMTPYDLRHLDMDSLIWAADVADEAASVRGGGTIPRYEVNGTLVFAEGAELEDQLQPLLDAGAAQWMRARGLLGLIPATLQDSALTLTDLLDDEAPTFVRYRPRDELYTEVSGTYLAPDRAYEDTEAPVYIISGAQAADGGIARKLQPDLSLITDHRQAQRVQKIAAMRTRAQRQVTGVFPPNAFRAVAGSVVTLTLPAPFAGWNGLYQIESLRPALGGDGDSGVHLRCSLALRETSAAVFAWDAETEEQVVEAYTLDASVAVLQPGGSITAVTGSTVAIVTGYGATARIKFSFDPSTSASTTGYDWEYRRDAGAWTPGGSIDDAVDDGAGHVFGFLTDAATGAVYDIRVRAKSGILTSGWVYSFGTVASTGTERWLMDATVPSYQIDGVTRTLGQVVTLSRASAGSYIDAGGAMATAAVDAARIDFDGGTGGLLVEAAATNLLLNSATLSTQSLTVAAVPHTLSFRGTGTVTLTGASMAGPLIGSGAMTLVKQTFTPSAGTLTLTVTGSVTYAQLETGSLASSWIATTGAAQTRAADVAAMTGVTAVLNLVATYGDGTTQSFGGAPVGPGYWPALTKTKIRKLSGTP